MYEDEMAFMSCEDRNYYRDARTRATLTQKPKGSFHWEVCALCDGRKTVVNPSIDASGLTAENFADDPDFAEDYISGQYDISCPQCGGRSTEPISDYPPGHCEACGADPAQNDSIEDGLCFTCHEKQEN